MFSSVPALNCASVHDKSMECHAVAGGGDRVAVSVPVFLRLLLGGVRAKFQ